MNLTVFKDPAKFFTGLLFVTVVLVILTFAAKQDKSGMVAKWTGLSVR